MGRRVDKALLPLTDVWNALSADHDPGAVTVPILLVHDADDRTVPLSEAQRTKAAYGDRAELMVTSGLGHSRVLGDEDVVRRIVTLSARHRGATNEHTERAAPDGLQLLSTHLEKDGSYPRT